MTDDVSQLMFFASEEERAAQQLLEDMELNPGIALVHLLRVWHYIACLQKHDAPSVQMHDTPSVQMHDEKNEEKNECNSQVRWSETLTLLAQEELSFPKQLSREAWHKEMSRWFDISPESLLLGDSGTDTISRSHLELHLRIARRAIRQIQQKSRKPRFNVWGVVNLSRNRYFWIAIGISLLIFGVYTAYIFFGQQKISGHWNVDFYSNAELLGEPVFSETASSISVDWRGENPKEGVPHSNFSTRWTTCLSLVEPKTVRVRLGADDGARLFINGKTVVGIWEKGGFRTTERKLVLPSGQNLLTLEYFQDGGASRVLLDFDTGDGFEDLPLDWIISPRVLLGKPSCS
jgi:hypothetical protein